MWLKYFWVRMPDAPKFCFFDGIYLDSKVKFKILDLKLLLQKGWHNICITLLQILCSCKNTQDHCFLGNSLFALFLHSKSALAFCYQNGSDTLWEKIVLVIGKNFWNSRLKVENLQNFSRSLEQFIKTVKGQNNFW